MRFAVILSILLFAHSATAQDVLPHSIWLEAESFGPLHGSNFSFQRTEKATKGSWSLSGPDVATAWTQGGESEFLSVAARADEPGEVVIGRDTRIPADGAYSLWVRYVDYRLKKQSFGVRIKQGATTFSHTFGEKPVVDDLDPMKLLWDCAFGWDHATAELKKGPAHVEIYTTGPTEARRQIDCLCLTTDASYHPCGREKPDCAAWRLLRAMRDGEINSDIEPPAASIKPGEKNNWTVPAQWKTSAHPVFLWNSGQPWFDELKKAPADHVEWPFNIDASLSKEFIADFRGKDLPVFGDAVSGPAIHIPLYPQAFAAGSPLMQWLDRHSDRSLAILLNYGDPRWDKKDSDHAPIYENLKKLGSRFIGFVAGESISYDALDGKALDEKVRAARTRTDVLQALREAHTAATIKKFSDYFGPPLSAEQAWEKVIPCLSAGNEAFAHAVADWGVKRIGHESSGNSPTLARRLAFLRGAARQFGAGIVDYQSCNLGDSSTIFSREDQVYPASSRYIFDNQYDAWAGAGVNWVLKDYLLFHVAGADAFYHEEGQDIFWKPGGGAAGDNFPIGLSPRGRVTEAVMQLAKSHPRGSQYTPIAFLLDQAHGYSQESFQPGAFGLDSTLNPAVLAPSAHEASIRGWFDVAYFPAPLTQNEPASAIRQTFVNGIFGDIFDVIVTSPGHTDIAKTYPVLIAAGDVPLTAEWGQALDRYCREGGTLVVCDGQFTGPGAATFPIPAQGQTGEASSLKWSPTRQTIPCNAFTFHPVAIEGARILATAEDHAIAVSQALGRGRLITVGIPMGLGIDQRPSPILALLLQHLTQGLMPIHVSGDVEWAVNRLDDGGWLITLLNNRGVIKPQHGVLPTDYHEAQTARLRTRFGVGASSEWVAGEKVPWTPDAAGATAQITIPAGVVRMVYVHPK
ncbi:MAG TPA: hypothetical protein VG326_02925 [Tepidisphaeraceae bacterium]|jgi:hypothetical protein|nr:hypothetical protein [Tepidisphaeraceae bacterium]